METEPANKTWHEVSSPEAMFARLTGTFLRVRFPPSGEKKFGPSHEQNGDKRQVRVRR